jgi:hypothetical protein
VCEKSSESSRNGTIWQNISPFFSEFFYSEKRLKLIFRNLTRFSHFFLFLPSVLFDALKPYIPAFDLYCVMRGITNKHTERKEWPTIEFVPQSIGSFNKIDFYGSCQTHCVAFGDSVRRKSIKTVSGNVLLWVEIYSTTALVPFLFF